MEAKTLAKLRKSLEDRRAEIEQDVSFMAREIKSIGEEQGDENGGLGNHIAEDGSSMTEAERLTIITDDMQAMVRQINAALERMDEGTYGTCERCGQQIREERLEAFPYVMFCLDCQAMYERELAIRGGR
ncbi:MAG: TraR/DksA family transcriptional regulator [Chloroflexota bacterium]